MTLATIILLKIPNKYILSFLEVLGAFLGQTYNDGSMTFDFFHEASKVKK